MVQTIGIVVDPSGAQTGGRVVIREFNAIGEAARTMERGVEQSTTGMNSAMKSAAESAGVMTRAIDDLRAQYNPLFAVIRRYKDTQQEIRRAHQVGALSTREMADALSRERQAALGTISALKGRTTALKAMGKAVGNATFMSRQLMFQLVDIGQTIPLAFQSPLFALQNVGFQLAQIGQLYAGQGGFMQALRDSAGMVSRFAARFAPLAAAAGGAAIAIGGITGRVNELNAEANRFHGIAASWVDVAVASIQVIANSIGNVLAPAIEALKPLWQSVWDVAGQGAKIFIDGLADNLAGIPDTLAVLAGRMSLEEMRNRAFERAQESTVETFNERTAERALSNEIRPRELETLFGLADQTISSAGTAAQSITRAGDVVRDASQSARQTIELAGRNQLASMQQMQSQIRASRREVMEINKALENLTLQPVEKLLGDSIGGENATRVIEGVVESVERVFNALERGDTTATKAHETIEQIRANLRAFGGDARSIDRFVDSLVNANNRTRQLQDEIESLSNSIRGIPDKDVRINVHTNRIGDTSPASDPFGTGVGVTATSFTQTKETQALTNPLPSVQTPSIPSVPSTPSLPRLAETDPFNTGVEVFAHGGIASKASIFGEAGPEAAVPLPDGRTIPVTLSGAGTMTEIMVNTAQTVDLLERALPIWEVMGSDIASLLDRMGGFSLGNSNGIFLQQGVQAQQQGGGPFQSPEIEPIFRKINGATTIDPLTNILRAQLAIAKASGGSTPLPAATGGQSTFGFARGGVIEPSGSGNTDTRFVRIMTRPDETVTVSTPEQRKAVVDSFDAQFDRRRETGEERGVRIDAINIHVTGAMDRDSARSAADEFSARVRESLSPLHGA